MCRELPLGFLSQYESNLKHRRHLLQSSTLHPPPQTQDKKKKGGGTPKRAKYINFNFKLEHIYVFSLKQNYST